MLKTLYRRLESHPSPEASGNVKEFVERIKAAELCLISIFEKQIGFWSHLKASFSHRIRIRSDGEQRSESGSPGRVPHRLLAEAWGVRQERSQTRSELVNELLEMRSRKMRQRDAHPLVRYDESKTESYASC